MLSQTMAITIKKVSMARPKTDPHVINRIGQLTEEGYKCPEIYGILQEEADDTGDWPSQRTVRRYYNRWISIMEPCL
jgi:hypothetical protein